MNDEGKWVSFRIRKKSEPATRNILQSIPFVLPIVFMVIFCSVVVSHVRPPVCHADAEHWTIIIEGIIKTEQKPSKRHKICSLRKCLAQRKKVRTPQKKSAYWMEVDATIISLTTQNKRKKPHTYKIKRIEHKSKQIERIIEILFPIRIRVNICECSLSYCVSTAQVCANSWDFDENHT